MKTLIGIDIGTSATRAVLIGADGAVIGSAVRRHGVSEPHAGHAEHDAELIWWNETRDVLSEIAARYPGEVAKLSAIGISAVGASIVPVDENVQPLRPAILYGIDRRALKQMDTLEKRLGAEEWYRRTGREFSTQSVGPKILWIEENEKEIAARTAQYLPPAAFLARRLGADAVVDPHTALAMHPLCRADDMAWDEDAVSYICRREQLPAIAPAGTPIGTLAANIAAMIGLPAGVPICCGTADVLADSIASGALQPGDTMVMYGSTLFIVHVTNTFQPRPPFWASVYPVGGHHCVVTGTSTAGAAADWWLEVADCQDTASKEAMLGAAANVRASDEGLIFLPYLRGERAPIFIPSARGVFFGLTTQHTSAHLYRAVLESIGFSLRHVLDEMHLQSRRIFVSGGGSDLELPLRLAVDASGVPQHKAKRGRSAGYGAAVLAGIGAGVISASALTDEFFGGFEVIEPQDPHRLDKPYALYRSVSAALSPLFAQDS